MNCALCLLSLFGRCGHATHAVCIDAFAIRSVLCPCSQAIIEQVPAVAPCPIIHTNSYRSTSEPRPSIWSGNPGSKAPVSLFVYHLIFPLFLFYNLVILYNTMVGWPLARPGVRYTALFPTTNTSRFTSRQIAAGESPPSLLSWSLGVVTLCILAIFSLSGHSYYKTNNTKQGHPYANPAPVGHCVTDLVDEIGWNTEAMSAYTGIQESCTWRYTWILYFGELVVPQWKLP